MKKKLLSITLVIALFCTMLSFSASAAGNTYTPISNQYHMTHQDNGVAYWEAHSWKRLGVGLGGCYVCRYCGYTKYNGQ